MVTITMDEIVLNAVRAALDERILSLEGVVRELAQGLLDQILDPETEDAQRAYVWNVAALHEAKAARDVFAEADRIPVADAAWWTWVPEQADSYTLAKGQADWTETELRIAAGDR